jgi:hypothetical protein
MPDVFEQIDQRLAHSRNVGRVSALCMAVAVLAVVAVVVLTATHRGLWPPPERSPASAAGLPG